MSVTLEIDGNIVQIIEFQHVKTWKRCSVCKNEIKKYHQRRCGRKTFRPTEKFPAARIERSDMQYLYSDGDLYNFMNMETYDQIALNAEAIGDALKFVKENEMVKICSPQRQMYLRLNLRCLWSLRSQRQNRALREIPLRVQQNLQQ